MDVAIINYDSGNLHSAAKAFERAAAEGETGHRIVVTKNPEMVRRAERVVLPGVGAYADCLAGLGRLSGMIEALEDAVRHQGKPFFGICVGMQLLSERGYEHSGTEGFGWIGGEVRHITPSDPNLKIPHMGWNTLDAVREHPLLEGIPTGPDGWHAYFVHSYAFTKTEDGACLATTDYSGPITAMVLKDNIVGTQFHPEKSQKLGLTLISNFLRWRP